MPVAQELVQEGFIIPPVRLYRAGALVPETLALFLRNVRTPVERQGDVDAQVAAQRVGERRLAALAERFGAAGFRRASAALLDAGERAALAGIAAIPPGAYAFEDALDDDGSSDEPVPIRLRLTTSAAGWDLDFTGSAGQRPGSINAVAAVTRSASYYVLRCLLPAGRRRPTRGCSGRCASRCRARSVVNAAPPAAVAAGNVETSQRIVDVVWGAIAQALPDRMPAASAGTMNNVAAGGIDPRSGESWAYYETSGGGLGGGPLGPGLEAVQSHMTNTLNTPAEALEIAYPMRVIENSVRRGSGGAGRHRGGDGLVRRTQFLAPATVTLIGRAAAPGAMGRGGRIGRDAGAQSARAGGPTRSGAAGQNDVRPSKRGISSAWRRQEAAAGVRLVAGALSWQTDWNATLRTSSRTSRTSSGTAVSGGGRAGRGAAGTR